MSGYYIQKQDCKINPLSLAILVQTFGKVILEFGTTQIRNSTISWYLELNQVAKKFLKLLATSFLSVVANIGSISGM